MVKTCFCICSLFLALAIQADTFRKNNSLIKKKIHELHDQGKFSESIPYIEHYLQKNPEDRVVQRIYAKTLLFRDDLPLPAVTDEIHSRSSKIKAVTENYKTAASIFRREISYLHQALPNHASLGKWYFLWALSEYYSNRDLLAIQLFKKAVKIDFTLVESYFNIASIYSKLGNAAEAGQYFTKYSSAAKTNGKN